MPLFAVTLTYRAVVEADCYQNAKFKASQEDLTDQTPRMTCSEITTELHIPPGWTPNCVPYGGDDETTIAGHLKKK